MDPESKPSLEQVVLTLERLICYLHRELGTPAAQELLRLLHSESATADEEDGR